MTKKETINFLERIKSHYQDFIVDDFKIDEWHRELEQYDAEDVNQKLDEHLKSSEYGEYIPKLFFLTKYLIPTKEKGKINHYIIKCQLCGREVPDTDYESHYKRCCSSNIIVKDLKQHFNLTVEYEKLMRMSDVDFDRAYNRYLTKMLESNKLSLLRKKIIMRCLYPNESTETLEDMLKGVSKI